MTPATSDAWADRDWIEVMIFKGFAEKDWINFFLIKLGRKNSIVLRGGKIPIYKNKTIPYHLQTFHQTYKFKKFIIPNSY